METELMSLRDGACTFEQFERSTRRSWQRLAGKLASRWRMPPSMDEQDLTQEMLIAVIELVASWDPDRKVKISAYVVWNAMNRAKLFLHEQRGANLHRPDKSKSRHPLVECGLLGPDVTQSPLDRAVSPPDQLNAMGVLDAMRAVRTERDLTIMEALVAAPSIDLAATTLYEDAITREQMQYGSPKEARRSVMRAARRFAERCA
jgi:DNA-directed RNA polymerase specialized sigma24 family protein